MTLSVADAVVILALVHFMDERGYQGEAVTEAAAMKIAALVSAFDRSAVSPLTDLGLRIERGVIWWVPEELLAQACSVVLRHEAQAQARAVARLCTGKRVAEVEQFDVAALARGRR